MALPITVPYTFGNATTAIPLSNLDSDYATVYQAVNGIGNGSVALANVTITGGTVSNVSGVVPTPFTANGVVYASSTSALATGSALTFDGTNFGLGVTPSAWNTTGSTRAFEFQNGLGSGSAAGWFGSVNFLNNAFLGGGIMRYVATGVATQYQQVSGAHQWFTAPSGTAGTAITFTQAMTLDASGNLLVGTTSQIAVGAVYGISTFNQTVALKWAGVFSNTSGNALGVGVGYSTTPNGTSNEFIYCQDSTALRMSVRSNGGIANYTANNVVLSDRREKTNFAPATSYLDKICAIPVQTFNYIDQNMEEDGGLTLGVVAQDVQAVAPELVTEGNWGTKENPKMRFEIYQTDLQYALMKSIQEQQALITQLTTRLTALENK